MGGTKLSDAALVRRFGRDEAVAYHHFQKSAVAHVADTLATRGIDADQGPDGELLLAHSPVAWQGLQAEAEARRTLYGETARLIPGPALAAEGFGLAPAHGAALTPVGFPLHPMKYVLGLAGAAQKAGVTLFGDSPVTELSRANGLWRLDTPNGSLLARQVLIATNGYSSEDLPPWIAGRTLPVFSTILMTRPLSAEEQRAQGWTSQVMAFDSRQLLHYFRLLPDGRFLFGMRGGLSADPAEDRAIQALARRDFQKMFPAWTSVETERAWSGLICLTGSLTPFAGAVPGTEGLYAAFGWHGNGVSTASLAGREVGHLMAGRPVALPAPIAKAPQRFPLPVLRLPMMRAAYAWYGWRDGALT
jgi:glycine/D-amino acid oxidase-like deaminating enzyme